MGTFSVLGIILISLIFTGCKIVPASGLFPASTALPTDPVAGLEILPSSLVDMGSVEIGTTATTTIRIRNYGQKFDTSALEFTVFMANSAEFNFLGGTFPGTGGTCTTRLAPLTTCEVVVEFAPTTAGSKSVQYRLNFHNGRRPSTVSLSLQASAYGATWVQEAYVKAANNTAGDWFGWRTAIDGDTMVVGVYREDSNQITITNGTTASADDSNADSGAAYVYRRSGSTWAQEAYLKAPNNDAGDQFGVSVAISGDTIVVGANFESSNQTTITNGTTASADNTNTSSGAAYVFKRTGTTWAQEAYLKAPNNDMNDFFGQVSISGDTIVVGSSLEDSNQIIITNGTTASADNTNTSSGAAYVFKRTGTTWAQEAYLKAPNNGTTDYFGSSVAISGDTIAVGADGESSNQTTITNGTSASADDSNFTSGAVYVFKRTGVNWAQEAYLKAPNNDSNDNFGNQVAIDTDTIAVGTYVESSNQTTITNGTTASADNSNASSGAVYVFKRTGVNWAQEAYIKASNNGAGDWFGGNIGLSSNTIAVGAIYESSNQTTITNGPTASSDNSSVDSGAAYVFRRTGTTWVQESYIKATNSDSADHFGISVAVSGDTVVVGSNLEDSNQNTITNGSTASSDNSSSASGAVYIYTR